MRCAHSGCIRAPDRVRTLLPRQVEVALPWSMLKQAAGGRRAPPRSGDAWRINFSRWGRQHGMERRLPGRVLHKQSLHGA